MNTSAHTSVPAMRVRIQELEHELQQAQQAVARAAPGRARPEVRERCVKLRAGTAAHATTRPVVMSAADVVVVVVMLAAVAWVLTEQRWHPPRRDAPTRDEDRDPPAAA
jgi:hypothetical protein